MQYILGLSAFYHDSAAALLCDGEVVAAAQEERFTRRKHDASFPKEAVNYCLAEAGIGPQDLDFVSFYDKPITKFERLLQTYLAFAPRGYRSFRQAMPIWLKQKLHVPREIRRGLGAAYQGRIVFTEHHESHAASAFFPSPFEHAAVLTLDGVGEWATSCIAEGRDNKLNVLQEMHFPHSLGLLYSAFTYYTGFRVNSGEYKLMGLAPYGEPVYRDLILEHLLELKEDGSFWLDQSYFEFCQGLRMTSERFHQLFDGAPRNPETQVTRREMDLAASVQAVTEEVVLRTVNHVRDVVASDNLVLAGGVALNCVANGKILREGPFQNIWIQPAAGDAGGALGTAQFVWHQLLEKPRQPCSNDRQLGSLLGPSYSDRQIVQQLDLAGAAYHCCQSDDELCDRVSQLIADENVVGWFQGRMEFGPRALGCRSILGDARSQKMQSVMNLKIKFRESFRPFAPIVLQEYVEQYFDLRSDQPSPYMLIVAPVQTSIRKPLPPSEQNAEGIEKLKYARSELPAVTHVDYSARIQTVDPHRNPLLFKLLTRFHELTGCAVMINTSFNVRSEPIVNTPKDALRCFMLTEMDALAAGHQVLLKSEQGDVPAEHKQQYRAQFELD